MSLPSDGTFRYANGDVYVGQFIDGRRQGSGSTTFANGNTYTGRSVTIRSHCYL